MKVITIAGNIGKDAQTRNAGDTTVTSFSVAVEERGKGGEKSTIWFDVAIWGKRGSALGPYLVKGGAVTVSGDLTTREHEGKTYLGVRANDIKLQGGRRDDAPASVAGKLDDEIPF